ncbi:ABC transporter permease [Alkalibacillus almallahensis]|uniref:ABC transporter permease n=1 Tax=Alkalibacillus almallahensis TaxID=1379154 RepID=UPI001423688A|nr:ABC transporter permease [Alkalibacillus almallahensis]NIK12632.1 putative ABC transport system permease protein [Alkalibacillus almallahensis]
MLQALYGAVESGLIYALMALGVYISFRLLDFPDLTVDGSFVTGGAVTSVMVVSGVDPFTATLAGAAVGFLVGCITGILHTKGNINPLLAGILMMVALYSINLRIMGQPNIPLLNETTVFTVVENWWQTLNLQGIVMAPFEALGIAAYVPSSLDVLVAATILMVIVKKLLDFFLRTEAGTTLRATGDNQTMVRSFSANTNVYIVVGIGVSNMLVAFSGSMVVQHNGFADINLGVGMIIIGLASVIIGEVLFSFGSDKIVRTTLAVILGAIVYRMIYAVALQVDFLEASDMKLITALIVVAALVVPNWLGQTNAKQQYKKSKANAAKQEARQADAEGEKSHATAQSHS